MTKKKSKKQDLSFVQANAIAKKIANAYSALTGETLECGLVKLRRRRWFCIIALPSIADFYEMDEIKTHHDVLKNVSRAFEDFLGLRGNETLGDTIPF